MRRLEEVHNNEWEESSTAAERVLEPDTQLCWSMLELSLFTIGI